MTHVAVLGAGIGGLPAAYEMRDLLGRDDKVTVINATDSFQFTPSNPWVAVGWRTPEDIKVPLEPSLKRRNIDFIGSPLTKIVPENNRLELANGESVEYDFLIIATGPELAFDEVEGLGPERNTYSICTTDHAAEAKRHWDEFVQDPGPIVVGAVQGASCYGPAYEFAMIMDTDLRRRKIRDRVPMTFVTAEPYIGHLGLGGVGDTKSMLESAFRDRDVRWICNAKVDKVESGKMHIIEMNEDGSEKKRHELPFKYSMMLPAFRGIKPFMGIDGLVNPRGFVVVDEHQRNPKYPNIFSVGVCIAIPPYEPTPVPVGVPKTGYMIESMVTATVRNIRAVVNGKEPTERATWNAICLADFGDRGVAFAALPQIPPRNVNWSSEGKWVHLAKVAFEKYFLRKVRKGTSEPIYERIVLRTLGIGKLKERLTR